MQDFKGALSDVVVLDLTQMLAGPYCTQLLADFGADVIKVEPLEGDGTRTFGPYHPDDTLREYGGYFQSINRNKRSIAIDLKTPKGQALLLRLVEKVDVLVENSRAGTLDKWGLPYERLKEINPRLVYASIRGFGDRRFGDNKYIDWPAYDIVAQAMGGAIGITGLGPDSPVKIGPGVGDLVPAVFAAFGVVTAVHHARRTGQGQYVDIAMVDCILAFCERIVFQNSVAGIVSKQEGNWHPLFAPYGLVKAKDGWVAIGCPTDRFWRTLCGLIGREDLLTDTRFVGQADRVKNIKELAVEITSFSSTKTKNELSDLCGGKIPFAPVYDIEDMKADPYFKVRNMLVEVPHPGSNRKTMIAGVPVKMTETPGGVRDPAPMLGADTNDVLAAAGFSAQEIAELRDSGVVR